MHTEPRRPEQYPVLVCVGFDDSVLSAFYHYKRNCEYEIPPPPN